MHKIQKNETDYSSLIVQTEGNAEKRCQISASANYIFRVSAINYISLLSYVLFYGWQTVIVLTDQLWFYIGSIFNSTFVQWEKWLHYIRSGINAFHFLLNDNFLIILTYL